MGTEYYIVLQIRQTLKLATTGFSKGSLHHHQHQSQGEQFLHPGACNQRTQT